jgi:hypothetical protein
MGNDKVELTLKRPWSDGTTRLVFTPLEFVQRLIPLIPMPGTNVSVRSSTVRRANGRLADAA